MITIIVLLILATVSISAVIGENGVITKARKSKDNTEIGKEKEIVNLAATGAKEDLYGTITIESLQKELNNLTNGNAEVSGEGPFTVVFKNSGRKYTVTINGNISIQKSLAELKESEEMVDGHTNVIDENGDSIIIPDGFNIDKDSPITVVEGIVVEDSYENQYVWIPVFEYTEERTWGADYSSVSTSKTEKRENFTEEDYTNIENALKAYTANYAGSWSDSWYGDETYGQYGYNDESENLIYYSNGNMTEREYNELYNKMLVSVYKNGGFYIGRYEMGIGVATSTEHAGELTRTNMSEYISTEVNADNEKPTIAGMPIPVEKANTVVYTYITQSQAQMLAKKMGEYYGYGNTTSSLMFGVQWDAICVFLEKYGTTNTGTKLVRSHLTGNTSAKIWGNYSNSSFVMDRGYYNIFTSDFDILPENWNEKSEKIVTTSTGEYRLCTTGASDQNCSLNIYDFGGNVSEITLEKSISSKGPVAYRGGYFGNRSCAYGRFSCSSYLSNNSRSSRIALWL